MNEESEGWSGYRRLVIEGLENLGRAQVELRTRMEVLFDSHAKEIKHEIDLYETKLAELRERDDTKFGELRDRITRMEMTIKFQAGVWSAVISFAVAVGATVLAHFLLR
jgi:hypothetical protein